MTLMNEFKKILKDDQRKNVSFYKKALGLEDTTTLSNEMIDFQIDDPFVKQCAKCFEDIIASVKKSKSTTTSAYLKKSEIRAAVDRIDMLVKDRFGLPIKHITDNMTPYACFPVAPNMNTVLDVNTNWDALMDYAKDKEIKGKVKDEIMFTENSIYRIAKSAKELEKTLNSKGITIDLKKAYISGLPNDYVCYVLFELNFLIVKCKMSPLELVAVLTHEIGHLFTHIEYTYKTLAKTNVLIETVFENTVKKGKSSKDTLLLIASEVLPDSEIKKLENKSTPVIAVNVIKGITKLTLQPHWYTDSEQLADQFSNRFGLGEELATALSKFPGISKEFMEDFFYFNLIPLWIITICCVLLTVFAVLPIGLMFVYLSSIPITLLLTIEYFRAGKEFETNIAAGRTYDDTMQRYNRIKLELIRRLRSCELPKPELNNILSKIETLDNLISNAPKVELGWFEQIKRFFNPSRLNLAESKEFEQLIENMMENKLHVASAKVKTLL